MPVPHIVHQGNENTEHKYVQLAYDGDEIYEGLGLGALPGIHHQHHGQSHNGKEVCNCQAHLVVNDAGVVAIISLGHSSHPVA